MTTQEALNNVRDWITRVLIASGSDPGILVTIYAYGAGVPDNFDRHETCGLRVAEVDVTQIHATGTSGSAWMQTEVGGIAVCAEVERCVVAQLEDWDSVQDGEIRDEFWRLGYAMLRDDFTPALWELIADETPGKPYEEN